LKAEVVGGLDDLRMNLAQVRTAAPAIAQVRTAEFWNGVTVPKLESMRTDLRQVMQYRLLSNLPSLPPKVINVTEDPALIERRRHAVRLEGLQLAAYRLRVEKVLKDLFETNETLQRIKRGQAVSETDLETLSSLVLAQDPMLNLNDLVDYYPDCAGHLDYAIRGIIGLDAEAVDDRFTVLVQQLPTLSSVQIRFLILLQNHIAKYGFTSRHSRPCTPTASMASFPTRNRPSVFWALSNRFSRQTQERLSHDHWTTPQPGR
jgi:type I restriction enzyme R subunit